MRRVPSEAFFGLSPNQSVSLSSDLRSRRLTSSDGPHRLVSNHNLGELLFGQSSHAGGKLFNQYSLGPATFSVFQFLAHTDYRRNARLEGRLRLPKDVRVRLTEVLAALAVSDQHPATARADEHIATNFPG